MSHPSHEQEPPVTGDHYSVPEDGSTVPDDHPGALDRPEVDEIREADPDREESGGDDASFDNQELRSMPVEEHGTDDDPASFMNP